MKLYYIPITWEGYMRGRGVIQETLPYTQIWGGGFIRGRGLLRNPYYILYTNNMGGYIRGRGI